MKTEEEIVAMLWGALGELRFIMLSPKNSENMYEADAKIKEVLILGKILGDDTAQKKVMVEVDTTLNKHIIWAFPEPSDTKRHSNEIEVRVWQYFGNMWNIVSGKYSYEKLEEVRRYSSVIKALSEGIEDDDKLKAIAEEYCKIYARIQMWKRGKNGK